MDDYEKLLEIIGAAPWYKLLGMIPKLQGDRVVVEMEIDKFKHLQALGMTHGGAIASVLDSAIGLNVNREILKNGKTAITAQLNIHYIRPVSEGKITGVGMPLHVGAKVIVGYGEVRNEDGELVAVGTATFYVIDRKLD